MKNIEIKIPNLTLVKELTGKVIQKFRQIRKRHIKRAIILIGGSLISVGLLVGTIDNLTNDTIEVQGKLYSKTYTKGKNETTYHAHYSLTHNGRTVKETIYYYENIWDTLVIDKDTRMFTKDEKEFQSPRRAFFSAAACFITFVIFVIGVGMIISNWWEDDNEDIW